MAKTSKKEGTENLNRLKGMRDLIGDDFYKIQGFFERASEVAVYYGFRPIDTPILERVEVFTSGLGEETDMVGKEMYTLKTRGGGTLALRPEGTAPIMRSYIEEGMHNQPQPIMLYYHGPFFRHENPQAGRYRQLNQFGLEVLGTQKSIADAMVIAMMHTILIESGIKNVSILVNSIGDKDCRPQYVKELAAYYRKYVNKLCPDCRERLKVNPLRLLDCKNPDCAKYKEEAPDAVSYLCDNCKAHFKEVLEFLEKLNIPYRIDHTLVRGIDYYTKTTFEFFSEVTEEEPKEEAPSENGEEKEKKAEEKTTGNKPKILALGGGGRYDYLARRMGSKRDTPAIGAALGVDRIVEHPDYEFAPPRIVKKPKAYFIQIGFEAKLRSLQVIETLRKNRIPLTHALSKDKLSVQLGIAEKMQIPFALILGQKEAVEGTVIVRNMMSRSQDTIKIDKLGEYLKKRI